MKATMNTTTTFLIVAFGMMTFIFFGIHTFSNITFSADVVAEDIEYLNAIDAAHLLKACLKSHLKDDNTIELDEIKGFDSSGCNARFSGLRKIGYEYRIDDVQSGENLVKSSGYDAAKSDKTHAIFINIATGNDIRIGRLHVRTG